MYSRFTFLKHVVKQVVILAYLQLSSLNLASYGYLSVLFYS
jgi:hypothetical protein